MRGLALIACALLLAGTARADLPALGTPPPVPTPDAGAPLDVPVELQAGQPAPFHGYELSDARATQLVINQDAQQAQATSSAAVGEVVLIVAVASFVAGAIAGAYVVAKVK